VDADKKTRRVEVRCKCCSRTFEAKNTRAMICSPACSRVLYLFRKGTPPRVLTGPIFDYVFGMAA
jgi:Zn finger protein HypA/HybF involved in hydrogenase expression